MIIDASVQNFLLVKELRSMTPDEICRNLGVEYFKEIVLSIPPVAIKKILTEAKLSTSRSLHSLSTKKRNEEWAMRLWNALGTQKVGSILLYAWLGNHKNQMLADFLDSLGVSHHNGLTDSDFFEQTEETRLHKAAQELLDKGTYEKRDVAAYLLFLEGSNRSNKFRSLQLEKYLNS